MPEPGAGQENSPLCPDCAPGVARLNVHSTPVAASAIVVDLLVRAVLRGRLEGSRSRGNTPLALPRWRLAGAPLGQEDSLPKHRLSRRSQPPWLSGVHCAVPVRAGSRVRSMSSRMLNWALTDPSWSFRMLVVSSNFSAEARREGPALRQEGASRRRTLAASRLGADTLLRAWSRSWHLSRARHR